MTVEEPPRLPVRYAIRLGDLHPFHELTAICFHCRHRARVPVERIAAGRPDERWLIDLEAKLRCTACGNRHGNLFEIRWSNVTKSDEIEC